MISRRDVLKLPGLLGLAPLAALARDDAQADYKIDIAPVTLDLSPHHRLTTTAARTRAEVEFTADNPGASLFHCHQQNHMDLGFMMLFDYA